MIHQAIFWRFFPSIPALRMQPADLNYIRGTYLFGTSILSVERVLPENHNPIFLPRQHRLVPGIWHNKRDSTYYMALLIALHYLIGPLGILYPCKGFSIVYQRRVCCCIRVYICRACWCSGLNFLWIGSVILDHLFYCPILSDQVKQIISGPWRQSFPLKFPLE